MNIQVKYEPTYKDSQFVSPVYYITIGEKEYKLYDVVDTLYKMNCFDKQIHDKLKDKRTSVTTVCLTIKDHLIKL